MNIRSHPLFQSCCISTTYMYIYILAWSLCRPAITKFPKITVSSEATHGLRVSSWDRSGGQMIDRMKPSLKSVQIFPRYFANSVCSSIPKVGEVWKIVHFFNMNSCQSRYYCMAPLRLAARLALRRRRLALRRSANWPQTRHLASLKGKRGFLVATLLPRKSLELRSPGWISS